MPHTQTSMIEILHEEVTDRPLPYCNHGLELVKVLSCPSSGLASSLESQAPGEGFLFYRGKDFGIRSRTRHAGIRGRRSVPQGLNRLRKKSFYNRIAASVAKAALTQQLLRTG
jgi:hypothetical protein